MIQSEVLHIMPARMKILTRRILILVRSWIDPRRDLCDRLFLHCFRVKLHDLSRAVEVSAPLPPELMQVLEGLTPVTPATFAAKGGQGVTSEERAPSLPSQFGLVGSWGTHRHVKWRPSLWAGS